MNSYQERVIAQTRRWASGNPQHNRIDNECCPDFSCCVPELFTKDWAERQEILGNLLRKYGQVN